MMEIPKTLDLQTTTLLIELFSSFKKEGSEKIDQSIKTILGILKSIQEERIREKVLDS